MTTTSPTTLHLKYRPCNLDQVVGHTTAVERLRGIIATGKYPNALLLTGPSSAGKTTLARCFAAEVLGTDDVERHPDYLEQNAGSDGGVDDVRQIIDVARLNPMRGKKRFIVIDEAHRLTGNAADAILKPLEQPAKNTIFILCSMDPEKFSSGKSRSLSNRCSQFVLHSPTTVDLCRFISRVSKAEGMVMEKSMIQKIAQASCSEFRTAAFHLEALSQLIGSRGKKSKVQTEDIINVLNASETVEDELAVRILLGVYAKKFSIVQKAILDAGDSVALVRKLLQVNAYMLNQHVLKGERHPKVWTNRWGDNLVSLVDSHSKNYPDLAMADPKNRLRIYASTQAALVNLSQQAASFLVPEQNLISAVLYQVIADK